MNLENLKNNFIISKLEKSSKYSKLYIVSVKVLMMMIIIILTTAATVETVIQLVFSVAVLGTIAASGRESTTEIS